MAEAVLSHRLQKMGVDAQVSSVGLNALVGYPADPLAVEMMAARGLDLSSHRARQITPEMVRSSDLVLVMEERQQRAVEALDSSARGRVHRLGRMTKFDIPDPYRRGRAAFDLSLRLVDRGLDELLPVFWRVS
jgi:protein-tyrosine phosphatase